MTYQKLILIGRLGADPEIKYLPSGQPVTNFSLAINRKFVTGDGQAVKEVAWFKVSAWGRLAEVCNSHLQRGGQVYIEGRLIPDPATGGPRIWSRQDGSPAASFEIHAEVVRFLGERNDNGNGPVEVAVPSSAEPEIPF